MDTNDLIAHSRSRFDHAAAKRTLKEKYQSKLIFAYNGGMFKASPEFITFLKSCSTNIDIVVLDLYDNPVRINVPELSRLTWNRYQEQMDAWLLEYQTLNKNR